MLAVPMVGAGLSFAGDVRAAAELAVLMVVGAAYGWLLSLMLAGAAPRLRAPRQRYPKWPR